jgi:hypothetical protein
MEKVFVECLGVTASVRDGRVYGRGNPGRVHGYGLIQNHFELPAGVEKNSTV